MVSRLDTMYLTIRRKVLSKPMNILKRMIDDVPGLVMAERKLPISARDVLTVGNAGLALMHAMAGHARRLTVGLWVEAGTFACIASLILDV